MIEAFLEALAAERGAARNTLESYGRDLKRLQTFLGEKSIKDASAGDLKAYFQMLEESDVKAPSRARHLSTLRQFFRFLTQEKVSTENPTLSLDRPRCPRPLPKTLSEEEVECLLAALKARPVAEAIRLTALLELLYATGMRVSELVTLKLTTALAGLQNATGLIVQGKGGRERFVPLTPLSMTALESYLKIRASYETRPEHKAWLFPSKSRAGHLTRQGFGQLLKQVAMEAGVAPSRVSPHIFRHAFASHLLHHGADLLSIQKLLGHADVATTEIYTHVLEAKKRELVLRHHPLSERRG